MLYQRSMAVTQLAVQESRVFHDLYCVGNFMLAVHKGSCLQQKKKWQGINQTGWYKGTE